MVRKTCSALINAWAHAQVLTLLMGPGAEAASRGLTPAQRAGVAAYRRTKLVLEGRFLALDPLFALLFD